MGMDQYVVRYITNPNNEDTGQIKPSKIKGFIGCHVCTTTLTTTNSYLKIEKNEVK